MPSSQLAIAQGCDPSIVVHAWYDNVQPPVFLVWSFRGLAFQRIMRVIHVSTSTDLILMRAFG